MAIFAAFLIALLVSLLFAPGYRRSGSLVPLVIFFFILFIAGIASQFWITPFGPTAGGVYWMPNLFFVLLLAFLFLAPSYYPDRRKSNSRVQANYQAQAEAAATSSAVVISAFVWIVLIALVIAVFIGYYRNPDRADAQPQQSNQSINRTSAE